MYCIVIKIGVGTGGKTSHREGVNMYVLIPMLSGGVPAVEYILNKQTNKHMQQMRECMGQQ